MTVGACCSSGWFEISDGLALLRSGFGFDIALALNSESEGSADPLRWLNDDRRLDWVESELRAASRAATCLRASDAAEGTDDDSGGVVGCSVTFFSGVDEAEGVRGAGRGGELAK